MATCYPEIDDNDDQDVGCVPEAPVHSPSVFFPAVPIHEPSIVQEPTAPESEEPYDLEDEFEPPPAYPAPSAPSVTHDIGAFDFSPLHTNETSTSEVTMTSRSFYPSLDEVNIGENTRSPSSRPPMYQQEKNLSEDAPLGTVDTDARPPPAYDEIFGSTPQVQAVAPEMSAAMPPPSVSGVQTSGRPTEREEGHSGVSQPKIMVGNVEMEVVATGGGLQDDQLKIVQCVACEQWMQVLRSAKVCVCPTCTMVTEACPDNTRYPKKGISSGPQRGRKSFYEQITSFFS